MVLHSNLLPASVTLALSLGAVDSMQSTHDRLDTLAAKLALLTHIDNWLGVVCTDDALRLLLHVRWSFPRVVDVFRGKVAQLGNVRLDESSIHVHLLPNKTRVKALDLVAEEPRARTLHPANGGYGELKIQHVLVEEVFPQDPRYPQVATSEEYSNALSCQEMGPAVLATLSDDGVNPGIPRSPLAPAGQKLVVFVPRKLDAEWVAFHGIKLGGGRSDQEGKVTKEQVLRRLLEELLASRGDGGKLLQLAEELAGRETPESQVRAEGVLRHEPVDWLFHRDNSCRSVAEETTQGFCLTTGPRIRVECFVF